MSYMSQKTDEREVSRPGLKGRHLVTPAANYTQQPFPSVNTPKGKADRNDRRPLSPCSSYFHEDISHQHTKLSPQINQY